MGAFPLVSVSEFVFTWFTCGKCECESHWTMKMILEYFRC